MKTLGTPDQEQKLATGDGIPMNDSDKSKFRGIAARINYLAMDRPDLQFAAKCLSRKMASPNANDWERARRIARYLKWRPRATIVFPFEDHPKLIRGFADSDWAGEKPSMKSTSRGVVF